MLLPFIAVTLSICLGYNGSLAYELRSWWSLEMYIWAMIKEQDGFIHNMVSWDETFVPGEGLRWKSRAKALDACLGDLTWRPSPGPLSCDPGPWLKSEIYVWGMFQS